MGVAFRQVNRAAIWYPAISLASNQGCRVRFGDLIDPILYLPDDCHPIAVLAWKRSNNPTTTATTAIQPSLQRRNSIAESVTSSATGSQLFVDANSDFATSDDGDDLPSYNNNNNNHHLPVPESATAHILEQLSPASSVSNDNPLYQLQARGPSSDGNGGGGGGESSPQNPTSSVIIKDTSPITTPVVPEGITFADKIAVSPLGSVLSETASTLSPNSHDSMTESPAGANASPISINSSSSPQSTGSNSPGKKELVSRFGSVVSPLYTDDESGFTLSFYYEVRIGLRGDEGYVLGRNS